MVATLLRLARPTADKQRQIVSPSQEFAWLPPALGQERLQTDSQYGAALRPRINRVRCQGYLMELRHLRRFITVAEELHFTRAAKRVRVEQSPLSKTIKQLEDELGLRLFDRDHRNTQLTQAGHSFLKDARGVIQLLDCAIESAKAIASHGGVLRIAVSDGAALPRLSSLLARYREKVPSVKPLLMQVSLAEQLRGLRNNAFDVGFARSENTGKDIEVSAMWQEPLVVAVSSRHPLLAYQSIPLEELLRYPLVMYHPEVCEGYCGQIERILRSVKQEPEVADRVTTLEMMFTLVAAGYGTGLVAAEQAALTHYPDIVLRPLAREDGALTTFLLKKANREVSESLETFINLASANLKDMNNQAPPSASIEVGGNRSG